MKSGKFVFNRAVIRRDDVGNFSVMYREVVYRNISFKREDNSFYGCPAWLTIKDSKGTDIICLADIAESVFNAFDRWAAYSTIDPANMSWFDVVR